MEGLQPPPFASALLVAVLLSVGNLVMLLTVRLAVNGSLPPGLLAGYRTAATRSSDAAWIAAHRAALPVNRLGAVAGALLAAGTLPLAGTPVPYLLALALTVLVTLGHAVIGLVLAQRAAKRELGGE